MSYPPSPRRRQRRSPSRVRATSVRIRPQMYFSIFGNTIDQGVNGYPFLIWQGNAFTPTVNATADRNSSGTWRSGQRPRLDPVEPVQRQQRRTRDRARSSPSPPRTSSLTGHAAALPLLRCARDSAHGWNAILGRRQHHGAGNGTSMAGTSTRPICQRSRRLSSARDHPPTAATTAEYGSRMYTCRMHLQVLGQLDSAGRKGKLAMILRSGQLSFYGKTSTTNGTKEHEGKR